jgi:hypothetical protein
MVGASRLTQSWGKTCGNGVRLGPPQIVVIEYFDEELKR